MLAEGVYDEDSIHAIVDSASVLQVSFVPGASMMIHASHDRMYRFIHPSKCQRIFCTSHISPRSSQSQWPKCKITLIPKRTKGKGMQLWPRTLSYPFEIEYSRGWWIASSCRSGQRVRTMSQNLVRERGRVLVKKMGKRGLNQGFVYFTYQNLLNHVWRPKRNL